MQSLYCGSEEEMARSDVSMSRQARIHFLMKGDERRKVLALGEVCALLLVEVGSVLKKRAR